MAALRFAAYLLPALANAESLTPTNWELVTKAGTHDVFLKFFKPSCPHCQAMASEWNAFMKEWKGHKKVVVAEVDCEGDGSAICSMAEVTSYPTMLYGNPNGKEVDKLTKYEGERTFEAMHKAAVASFGVPKICKPGRGLKFCDTNSKRMIGKLLEMQENNELVKHVKDVKAKLASIDETFDTMINKVTKKLEKLQDEYRENKEDEAKAKELQEKMDSLQGQFTGALKIKDDSVKKLAVDNGLEWAEMILEGDDSDYDPDLDDEMPQFDEDYDPDFEEADEF